jgi:3-hydroxyacyl-[acyl-carrier-protein] dehydratase
LKINDKRVDPSKIENNLKQSGFIEDALCLKIAEKLACLCVPNDNGKKFMFKNGHAEFVKTLKQISKEEIIPSKWRFCGLIPVNSRGKRDISAIKRYFEIKFSYPVILNETVNSDKASFSLYFPKESNFYEGHFPGYPITPGVVLLFTVKELARLRFGKDFSKGQFKRIKFSKIIKPDETVTLNLEIKAGGLFYEYEIDGQIAASGILPLENVLEKS